MAELSSRPTTCSAGESGLSSRARLSALTPISADRLSALLGPALELEPPSASICSQEPSGTGRLAATIMSATVVAALEPFRAALRLRILRQIATSRAMPTADMMTARMTGVESSELVKDCNSAGGNMGNDDDGGDGNGTRGALGIVTDAGGGGGVNGAGRSPITEGSATIDSTTIGLSGVLKNVDASSGVATAEARVVLPSAAALWLE